MVLVDENSIFAGQACSMPLLAADLARENGLVHDVQKLAEAVVAQMR